MKTTMKTNLIYFLIVISGFISILSSCKDDEKLYQAPVVTAPEGIQAVAINDAIDVTFTYTSEAGFKTAVASVDATSGTATIKTNGTAGSTEGTIVVTFSAKEKTGAAVLSLTVTDNESQTGTINATISVEAGIPVTANITTNTTWETGKVYVLKTRVVVVDGVTLTIEPGVIVKGDAGSAENATALLIARGAKIMAEGTSTQPIIFTSTADLIQPGDIESPNLGVEANGLWGGLLICGKAPISVAGNGETKQIEGIPASDASGLYGGTVENDNSGVLKYISIRHGGTNIGEGNEINGLTLAGVGSGTVVENIEVVSNFDDGIEFFGGSVNVTNVVVWNCGDDGLDTDQSYRGTVDNFVVINPFDEALELDGPEGTIRINDANHTFTNGSIKAGDAQGLVDNDPETNVNINHVYFYSVKSGQDFDELPNPSHALFSSGTNLPAFGNLEIKPSTIVLTDYFKGGSAAYATAVDTPTVGADTSAFSGWALSSILTAF